MQARSKDTKEKIILSAARLFDSKGYERASITDIATEAGVTQGAIYFHFKSKEEIALAVVQTQHAISKSKATLILAEKRPAVESLIRITAQFGKDLIQDPVVRAGTWLNIEKLEFPLPVLNSWDEWASLLSELFARGIREGDLREDMDTAVYASFLSKAYVGVQMVSDRTTGYANLIDKIFEMWIVMIEAIGKEDRQGRLVGCANEILLKGRKRCDGLGSEVT